jgi:hypothetical protein
MKVITMNALKPNLNNFLSATITHNNNNKIKTKPIEIIKSNIMQPAESENISRYSSKKITDPEIHEIFAATQNIFIYSITAQYPEPYHIQKNRTYSKINNENSIVKNDDLLEKLYKARIKNLQTIKNPYLEDDDSCYSGKSFNEDKHTNNKAYQTAKSKINSAFLHKIVLNRYGNCTVQAYYVTYALSKQNFKASIHFINHNTYAHHFNVTRSRDTNDIIIIDPWTGILLN